jgi:Xaa-Pro aminopeptidase
MLRFPLLLVLFILQDAARPPELPLSEFKNRRERMMKDLGDGTTVLAARKPHEKFTVEWPTDPAPGSRVSFFYFVGRNYQGAKLFMRHSDKKVILFVESAAKVKDETGIEDVRPAGDFDAFIKEEYKAGGTVFVDAKGATTGSIKEVNETVAFVTDKFNDVIIRMREIKNEAEMKMMRRAADVSCRAHVKVMKTVKAGMTEIQLKELFEKTLQEEGCDALAYPSIVGAGKHTPVIHHKPTDKPVDDGELVLNDSAGSYRGYAVDITRTWPVNGKFTELQRKEYQAVLDAQKAAEKILKPGVTWRELQAAAAKAIENAGFGQHSYARVHGLGHFVGLQTHDTGNYRDVLKEGMVITIEPGIYDKDSMTSIRIEDMYLVTKDGCERFSTGCPREIDEIEKLMSGR